MNQLFKYSCLTFAFLCYFQLFSQEVEYKKDTMVYSETDGKKQKESEIKQKIIGNWSRNKLVKPQLEITDSTWTFNYPEEKLTYRYGIKFITDQKIVDEEISIIYLCRTCKSFTHEDSIPSDEILIYSIDKITDDDFFYSEFLVGEEFHYERK